MHEFKIVTYDRSLEMLGVNNRDIARCSVNLSKVVAFYESEDDDGKPVTTLIFSNDRALDVMENYDMIKKLLNTNS